jgi:hypothetical protein
VSLGVKIKTLFKSVLNYCVYDGFIAAQVR